MFRLGRPLACIEEIHVRFIRFYSAKICQEHTSQIPKLLSLDYRSREREISEVEDEQCNEFFVQLEVLLFCSFFPFIRKRLQRGSMVIATLPTRLRHPTIWSLVHRDPISMLRLYQNRKGKNMDSRSLKHLHVLNLTKLTKLNKSSNSTQATSLSNNLSLS
jgi:hypothetical protein